MLVLERGPVKAVVERQGFVAWHLECIREGCRGGRERAPGCQKVADAAEQVEVLAAGWQRDEGEPVAVILVERPEGEGVGTIRRDHVGDETAIGSRVVSE